MSDYENMEWIEYIPIFNFPSEWGIKVVPPFGGAVIRFQVFYNYMMVSVYLDCHDNLGFENQPYFEADRADLRDDDLSPVRVLLKDSDDLIPTIKSLFDL
jgi:hypothetical protein